MLLIVSRRIGLLPIYDSDAILLVKNSIQKNAQAEQLAEVDTDRQHAARAQHLLHHPQARCHKAQPLGVPRSIVWRDKGAEVRIIRILVPSVVVSKIVTSVVWRIRQD